MDEYARQLVEVVETVLPRWVERSVDRVHSAWVEAGGLPGSDTAAHAAEMGRQAGAEVGAELRALFEADIDEQRSNPLGVLRHAVRYPTLVLRCAGVPCVERSEFDVLHFPDDDYGLTPMTFADVDDALHEPGILWGAMKARLHLDRHRRVARDDRDGEDRDGQDRDGEDRDGEEVGKRCAAGVRAG